MNSRVLWLINVYSRVDHLKQQQHLLRLEFGDTIKILTFCNKAGTDARYKEDFYVHTDVNSGHHNGVKDSFNAVLPYLKDFDYVVCSHADVILTDYSIVADILWDMKHMGKKLAQLCSLHGHNTHMNRMVPYVYCDFFVIDARALEQIGKIEENCDNDRGIETVMGQQVRRVMSEDEMLVIPARDLALADPACRFEWVRKSGVTCLRENDMGRKMTYLKEHHPNTHETLSALDASLAPR